MEKFEKIQNLIFSNFQFWLSMEKKKREYEKQFVFPYYCPYSVF